MTAAARGRSGSRRVAVGLACAALLAGTLVALPAASATAAAPGAAPDSLAEPQRDVFDLLSRALGRRVEPEVAAQPTPGLSFTILPSLGYNPSYGAFIGISAALGGWLGEPSTTTPSAASAGASYSTTGQTSVHFKFDFFTPDNAYVLKGDWRYLDTSQPTFGLGEIEKGQQEYDMDFVLNRFYQTIYRRIYGTTMFLGAGYHFNRFYDIRDVRADLGELTPFVAYSLGYPKTTTSSGVSVNLLFDSRDNPINARSGVYWNASLRSHAEVIGGDDNWQMLWSELRAYPPLPRGGRNTLAIWNYLWLTFGQAPYLDLPASGWDTYGRGARGFLQGRIRGTDQIYTEGEYRMSLSRDGLWGAVMFLNLTATTESAGEFGSLDPGYGLGLRVKFNKRTSTNLSLDYGFGQTTAGYVFIGLQEVF
jgi:hypothetical protein